MNPDDFFPPGFGDFVRSLSPAEFLEAAPELAQGQREVLTLLHVLHAGLIGSAVAIDSSDPVATGAVLRGRLAGTDRDTAGRYVLLLAAAVHLPPPEGGGLSADQYEEIVRQNMVGALAVMEGYAGLQADDYPWADGDPGDRLGDRLRAAVAGMSPTTALGYVFQLAGSCSHNPTRGTRLALAVIESFFGLAAGRYTPDVLETRVTPWCRPLTPGFCQLLAAWLPQLMGAERATEARALLGWLVGWTDGDLTDGWRLAELVRQMLAGLPPDFAVVIWSVVPHVMHLTLPRATVRRYVELMLDIQPETYLDPAAVVERLTRIAGSEEEYVPDAVLMRTVALLRALHKDHATEQTIQVFRAVAGIAATEPVGALGDPLRAFVGSLPVHSRCELHKLVATTLFRAKELAESTRYLEQVFGITPADYADPAALAGKLRYTTQAFSPEEPVLLAGLLFGSLSDDPARDSHAFAVADASLWRVLDLGRVTQVNAGVVFPVCMMLEAWLDRAAPADAYRRCEDAVRFLRQCLDVRGFHLEDRARFLGEVATLRRRIVQVGYEHAGTDPAEAARVLAWDAELGQRVLFERYRFHHPAPPGGPHPDAVLHGWSLTEAPPGDDGYLPPAGGPDGGRFGVGDAAPVPVDPAAADLANDPDARCLAATAILRSGITAEQLAVALGPEAVLLRAGFLADGRLFWRAFRSDGATVACVAGGTSSEPTADAVAAAVAWHDRVLDAVWAEHGKPDGPLAEFCRDCLAHANDLRTRLAVRRGTPFDPLAVARTTAGLLARCQSADSYGFADWFRPALSPDWAAADRLPLADAWAGIAATLRELATAPLVGRLDAATAAFLRRAAGHWDLSALRPHLTPDTDVVVEVDDHLHAVPVAFLPVGGGEPARLFELVRSVRSSLSPLLRLLHADDPPPPAAGGLLTVSWFAADDPARAGARWLHHGQAVLARRYGLGWASAGDRPPGRADAVAGGLAGGGVRVLAVCGHGQAGGPGVRLAGGEAWAGEGCDLGRVSWLLSVSCSIGRLAQRPGVPDVDGFTAALFARRARAALACRWPVHAAHAAGFANAATDEYLNPDRQTGRADRAAALARARRRFVGRAATDPTAIGLNTAAAFDLYGEG